jgi:anti-sigma factor RsiW
MLGAYLDGELDANAEFQMRSHLEVCPDCPDAYHRLSALKQQIKEADLYYTAPAELVKRISNSLPSPPKASRGADVRRQWLAVAASLLVAISLGLAMYVLRSRQTSSQLLAQQIVSSHVRAMMGTHLVDVPSSDQHTVKPWFAGKLDFSPPVNDLAKSGFVLVGGRMDYIGDHAVAALVYERRKHIINLFIWPSSRDSREISTPRTLNGYNIIEWTRGTMSFCAVSDLNLKELREFADLSGT